MINFIMNDMLEEPIMENNLLISKQLIGKNVSSVTRL